jgi:cytoskeletal protein CcmA (bactofilin family)
MADSSQDFATIIGADASFKGDLQFDSAAKVLGKFEGSINSKGKVHIADGCTCRATVSAKEIAVEGRVDGNIEAGDRIEIRPTGVVAGDIVATR